jgi:Pumilio-family RNA binding repeat
MPQTGLNIFRPALNSPANEQTTDFGNTQAGPTPQKPQRHSSGVTFGGIGESSRYEYAGINSISSAGRPISLQSSYSTNDVPTLKNPTGVSSSITPSKTYADQQLYTHNANMGRIPTGAASKRQSRDIPLGLAAAESKREDKVQSMQSQLQASAAPFGLYMNSTSAANAMSSSVIPYRSNSPESHYGFGMQTYNLTTNPTANQLQTIPGGYNGYPTYSGYGRLQDNQTRIIQQRRPQGGNEAQRFDNMPIEAFSGSLYEMCKDQHGCRYLQKKLEEKNPDHTMMIFNETCPFVIELMTGK